jgi:hypothetical protein
VALNCTHWALDGRKTGRLEDWKNGKKYILIAVHYSNIPITSLMYNKKGHKHHQRGWLSNST